MEMTKNTSCIKAHCNNYPKQYLESFKVDNLFCELKTLYLKKTAQLNLGLNSFAGETNLAKLPKNPCIGLYYFDIDHECPLWWNGTYWVKVDGTEVLFTD